MSNPMVWIFSVFCLCYVSGQTCIYPKEMYGTESPWRILKRDFAISNYHQYRRLSFKVSDIFIMDYMEGRGGDNPVKSITFRCVAQKSDRKYLVMKETEAEADKYQCIQFLIRNKNVVQWKLSEAVEKRDDNLCNDANLELLDDPLIYYYRKGFWREKRNRDLTYDPCPIEGGYLLEWKDPLTRTTLCEGEIPPLKVENDCTRGQGMRFRASGKNANCRGRDAQILDAQFLCLGHWEQGDHTFMLIAQPNEEWNHVYCMRVPKKRKGAFDGHIFLDTTCDSTQDITKSRDFREMSLRRHPVEALCSDETPACDQFNNTDCDFTIAESCRKSCGVCQDDEDIGEEDVFLPETFMGEWLKQTDRLGKEMVTVFSRSIKIPSLSRYTILGESTCGKKVNKNARYRSYEYVMSTPFDNGCSPQMVAMIITNRSASVLSYSISQHQMLAVSINVDDDLRSMVNRDVWGYECANLDYSADVDPIYDTYKPYKGGWFNLVRMDSNAPTVACDFPFNETLRYVHLASRDDTNCTGEILTSASKPNQVKFYIESCSFPSGEEALAVSKQTVTYECLANFESDQSLTSPERTLLITHTQEADPLSMEYYQCWVFLTESLTAYWVPFSECDSNIVHHIEAKFKVPMATLSFSSGQSHIMLNFIVGLISFILHLCN